MPVIKMKPTSPGTRFVVKLDKSHLWKGGPHEPLTVKKTRHSGRNNVGRITTRHQGSGTYHKYRIIDFKRDKDGIKGVIERLEHDPNRTCHIALVKYSDGERRYILAAKGMSPGDEIRSGADSPIKSGNSMQLRHIPVGSIVHNIELKPGKGGQMARSAGSLGQLHRARRHLRHAAPEERREPQGARRLPRHDRRSVERRAQPARVRQGRREALARHSPDGAWPGHEPGRPPARWWRR